MKIVSIEPTPSPHSMKLNVDTLLPDGTAYNYQSLEDTANAPTEIKQLLQIEGVKGLYHVADFIALEKNARYKWEELLPQARVVFGEVSHEKTKLSNDVLQKEEAFGEIKVWIQMFRDLPMQVKLSDGEEEKRFGLPERFMKAAMEASAASDNFVMERKWVEQTPRYGTFEEAGSTVVDEISASFGEERLEDLVQSAIGNQPKNTFNNKRPILTEEVLENPDWKVRYAALDHMQPEPSDIPLLGKALHDEKASIRRLATAYLGMFEETTVLPYLYTALKDNAVTVRRTAGDCLSDLGFKEAMPEMLNSLKDPNRLVRWRAAMFLYEMGDETAVPALKEAANDPEFEVRMQVNMALERIQGGEKAKGSVWHQMTQATKNN